MHPIQAEQQHSTLDVPDWTSQQAEISCPMCDYNLRGLSEPRCPECGYRFEWKDLLNAKLRPHPYLFEHHPERNFRSFWQTAWGGLRPWKFWSTLHAGQTSKPRRLVFYWFAAVFVGLLAVALVPFLIGCIAFASFQHSQRAAFTTAMGNRVPPGHPMFSRTLDQLYPLAPSKAFFKVFFDSPPGVEILLLVSAAGVYAVWPWLTFVVLMIFRISMRRAKIRPIHVLRCVLYSWDVAPWVGLLGALLFIIAATLYHGFQPVSAGVPPQALVYSFGRPNLPAIIPGYSIPRPTEMFDWANRIVLGLLIASNWKLMVAYQKYLRFDWPKATVFASQAILLLFLIVAALWLDTDLTTYWLRSLGLHMGARDYWWM